MLRGPFQARALSAVTPRGSLIVKMHANDFVDAIARGVSDVAVLDPLLASGEAAIPVSLSKAHLGTLLYIELTPEYAQASIELIRELGSGEIVTFGYNDDPATFGDLLRRQSRASRGQLLIGALKRNIAKMSTEVRRGIAQLGEQGHRIDSAERLAALCGVTRGTLFRNFRTAGIVSASGLVTGLTFLRNYDLLIDHNFTMRDVARAVGLSSERALREGLSRLANISLNELRAPMSIEEFNRRIADTLTTPRRRA